MPILKSPSRISFSHVLEKLVTPKSREAVCSIGLDVGSSQVKLLALGKRTPQAGRPILAYESFTRPSADDQLAAKLRETVDRLKLPSRSVNLSVNGPSVILRVVEMPAMPASELKRALPFEAQRYLPFPIQEVTLDGEILGNIDPKRVWVLLVACKKDVIETRLEWVRRAGLDPGVMDVDALALTNSFLKAALSKRHAPTSALVHTGAQFSSVVIFKEATPYLVRDIPWGADRLLKELCEQSGWEAERVRRGLQSGDSSEEFRSVLKSVCESLVVELQLSFDYFENQFGQPPEEIFLSGGLAKSESFFDAMKQHLAQGIARWEPSDGLSGEFAVAYGLALRS